MRKTKGGQSMHFRSGQVAELNAIQRSAETGKPYGHCFRCYYAVPSGRLTTCSACGEDFCTQTCTAEHHTWGRCPGSPHVSNI